MKMEFNMNLNLKLFVSNEEIEDIIDTAGYGIGYWASKAYVLRNDEDEIIKYNILEREENKWHELSVDNIINGIKHAIENGWLEILCWYNGRMEIDAGAIDSVCADTIMQYACFGEVVYG